MLKIVSDLFLSRNRPESLTVIDIEEEEEEEEEEELTRKL
jgi:hypothetical protein